MKQYRFYPVWLGFGILAISIFPLLARAQGNLSAGHGANRAVDGLSVTAEQREGFGERSVGGRSKTWQRLLSAMDKGQAVRLMPDTLQPDALVLRQIERGDVEAHLAVGSRDSTLTYFIVNRNRAPNRLRDHNLLGLEDPYFSQPRLEGTMFSGKVVDLAPMQLTLSSVYLEEQLMLDTGITRDHAWSLGADARWWSDQLQLYGEYAWSRHTSTLSAARPAQDDGAYKLQLSYRPRNVILGKFPLDWAIGIKHQRVGAFFRSPAAPQGRRNVSLVETFTHWGWRDLTLDTLITQEKSNFVNLPLQPLYSMQRAQFSGGYRLHNFGFPSWLGEPSLNWLFSKRSKATADEGTANAKLEAGSSHERWTWKLSQMFSWHESEIYTNLDGRSKATSLETRLKFFDNRLSLAPRVQYRRSTAELNAQEQWSAGVDTCAVLIPERLKGQVRVDVKRSWNERGVQQAYSTRGDLNWQLTRHNSQGPLVHFFLEGRYEAIVNQMSSAAFVDDYLVFFGVAFN